MDEAVYSEMAELQATHWWYRGRRRILATLIQGLGLPAGARILEAGCGPGGNLGMLGRFGAVSAFEPHDGARAEAIRASGTQVERGALPDQIPFPDPFDLVCAFDVVEHVEDDLAAVRALAATLAPGGRLLLTVPANPWLWSAHDERNHHFRRYTRDGFASLVHAAGLSIDHLSAFNSRLLPVIAGTRFVQKALKLGSRAEESMPSPRTNALLERIFAGEAPRVAAGGYGQGVSLVVVASQAGGRGDQPPHSPARGAHAGAAG